MAHGMRGHVNGWNWHWEQEICCACVQRLALACGCVHTEASTFPTEACYSHIARPLAHLHFSIIYDFSKRASHLCHRQN